MRWFKKKSPYEAVPFDPNGWKVDEFVHRMRSYNADAVLLNEKDFNKLWCLASPGDRMRKADTSKYPGFDTINYCGTVFLYQSKKTTKLGPARLECLDARRV